MSKQVAFIDYVDLVERKIKAEAKPLTEKEIEDLTQIFPPVIETACMALMLGNKRFIENRLAEVALAAVEFRARGLKLKSIDFFLEMVCDIFGEATEEVSEETLNELNTIHGTSNSEGGQAL